MKEKFKIISPDGFTIERDVVWYNKKDIERVFNNWKTRFEVQGYYSSSQYGRIPLDQLINYCVIEKYERKIN
jgi:hypothetical protein